MIDDSDIQRHRKARLRTLIDEEFDGKIVALANRIGREGSYLGRMLYPPGKPQARPVSDKLVRVIEKACGLQRGWFDLAETGPVHAAENYAMYHIAPVEAVHIPRLANPGSMGGGEPDLHGDVFIGALAISREWVQRVVRPTSVTALCFIHGRGESMSPTFEDGDVLLVDTGACDPYMLDGVYALRVDDQVFIKRVRRRMDGQLEVSSDNPTVKTVDVLDGTRPLNVAGRVICAWNWRRL